MDELERTERRIKQLNEQIERLSAKTKDPANKDVDMVLVKDTIKRHKAELKTLVQ